MNVTLGDVLLIAGPCLAGITWLLRLEGRVNVADARFQDLKADVAEIKADIKVLLTK